MPLHAFALCFLFFGSPSLIITQFHFCFLIYLYCVFPDLLSTSRSTLKCSLQLLSMFKSDFFCILSFIPSLCLFSSIYTAFIFLLPPEFGYAIRFFLFSTWIFVLGFFLLFSWFSSEVVLPTSSALFAARLARHYFTFLKTKGPPSSTSRSVS